MKKILKKLFVVVLTLCLAVGCAVVPGEKSRAAGKKVVSVSLGALHSAAILEDGSLWMWGRNAFGELGDGTTTDKSTPVKILDNVKSVSLGDYHSAAIKEDGSLWLWGRNIDAQLGDGTTTDKSTPVKILDNVKSVSLGRDHSGAIKEDGSLWMWGVNYWGQLGDGTREDKPTPVKILDNVRSVSLGGGHSAAIKEDGSFWMWGSNVYSRLYGVTTSDKSSIPVKHSFDDVRSVSLGGGHSAVIKGDRSLWMWGLNTCGQLGGGKATNESLLVNTLDNVKSVSLGDDHSAAIKEDGGLWMWGNAGAGSLGDGTTTGCKCVPVKTLDNVKNVSLGDNFSAAIKEDGSLWMWGANDYGQLGDGTTEYKSTPTQITFGDTSSSDTTGQSEAHSSGGIETTSRTSINIQNDTWNFGNLSETISSKYYNKFWNLSPAQARLAYQGHETSEHGHCFGMVVSAMSSVCKDAPSVSSYSKENLYEVKENTRSKETALKTDEYIKYAHIYQFTPEVQIKRKETEGDLQGLYNAVKNFAENKGDPVAIDIYGVYNEKDTGHALWALGIQKETDTEVQILVYDCNTPGKERFLKLYKKNGEFDSWSYVLSENENVVWKDRKVNIDYLFPADGFIKQFGSTVGYKDGIFDVLLSFVGNIPDTGYDVPVSGQGDLLPIKITNGGKSSSETAQYWLKSGGKSLKFTDILPGTEVNLAAANHSVSVQANTQADITMKVADKTTNVAKISLDKPGTFEVTYYDAASGSQSSENVITGKGSGTVKVEQKGEDFLVTGATEIKISSQEGKENEKGDYVSPQKSTVKAENLDASKTYQVTTEKKNVVIKESSKNNGSYDKVLAASASGSTKPVQLNKTYESGKLKYKVTKLTATGGTAAVTAPKSKSVTSITIPATVTLNGHKLKVTEISPKAFKGCTKLKSVTIGKNVKKIGKEAFKGDAQLAKVTFEGTALKSVGDNAIKGIGKKAELLAPKKALSAYKKLFTKKTGCTSKMAWKSTTVKTWTVTFKNGGTTVKTQKVSDGKAAAAPKLTKKGYVLSWSTSYKKVTKNLTVKAVWTPELPEKGYKKTVNGLKYKVTKSDRKSGTVQLIGVSSRKLANYTVPAAVKIGKYKFSVTGIGAGAFKDCARAKSFSLPKTVKTIGKNAFAGTPKTVTVTVPKAQYKSLQKQLLGAGLSKKATIRKK